MSARVSNTYPSYEESAIRWIGAYPSSWTLSRVKFESYVKARVGWHGLKSDDFTDEGPYLVTGTDFSGSRINWPDCHHCDEWRYDQDPYIQLREGDLLVTKDGTIGKLALVEGLDGKATLNSGVFVVRPLTTRYISGFYFWLLQSSVFHGFVEYRKTGSTIVHLYQETFENFSFAMPPVAEQTQIVNFLDYETAKIDALIEKQQQLIALLKEKRQAVISHAVTKGLNADAAMRDSGIEWLGEVPAHWEVCRVKQTTSFITSGPRGWSDLISEEGSDVFLQSGDLNDKLGLRLETAKRITPPRNAEGVRTKMQDGDVVVCITGANTGRVAVASRLSETVFVNQHLSLVRPVRERVHPTFLATILASSSVKSYFAVKQYGLKEGLSLTNVAEAPLCLPPASEQQAIVAHVTAIGKKMDRLEVVAVDQVAVLQERRTALISAAVTGKIDVRDWRAPEFEAEAEVA